MSVAVLVTPPPDAEIVTLVGTATADVAIEKPAAAAKAGIVTLEGTLATAGLLLCSRICTSCVDVEASPTRPVAPFVAVVVVGSIVNESGGTWGVNVSWA